MQRAIGLALSLAAVLAAGGVSAEDPDAGLNAPWNDPVPGDDPDAGLNAPWQDPAVFCAAYPGLPDEVKRLNRARWLRECRKKPAPEGVAPVPDFPVPGTLPDVEKLTTPDFSASVRLGFPVRREEGDRQSLEVEVRSNLFVAPAIGRSLEVAAFFSEKDVSAMANATSSALRRRRLPEARETFVLDVQPTLGSPVQQTVEVELTRSLFDTAFWCVWVDPNDRIRESNENNNIACVASSPGEPLESSPFAAVGGSGPWLKVQGSPGPTVSVPGDPGSPGGPTRLRIDWSDVTRTLAEKNMTLLGSYYGVRRGSPWPSHACELFRGLTWSQRYNASRDGPLGRDWGGFEESALQAEVNVFFGDGPGSVYYVAACLYIRNEETGRESFGVGSRTIEVRLIERGLDERIAASQPAGSVDLFVEAIGKQRDGSIVTHIRAEWAGDRTQWFQARGENGFPFEWEILVAGQRVGRGEARMGSAGLVVLAPTGEIETARLWLPGPGNWEVRARVFSLVGDSNLENNELQRDFVGLHIDEPKLALGLRSWVHSNGTDIYPIEIGPPHVTTPVRLGVDMVARKLAGTCAPANIVIAEVRGMAGSKPLTSLEVLLEGTDEKTDHGPFEAYRPVVVDRTFEVLALGTPTDRVLRFTLTAVDADGRRFTNTQVFRLPGQRLLGPEPIVRAVPYTLERIHRERDGSLRQRDIAIGGASEIDVHPGAERVLFRPEVLPERSQASCLTKGMQISFARVEVETTAGEPAPDPVGARVYEAAPFQVGTGQFQVGDWGQAWSGRQSFVLVPVIRVAGRGLRRFEQEGDPSRRRYGPEGAVLIPLNRLPVPVFHVWEHLGPIYDPQFYETR